MARSTGAVDHTRLFIVPEYYFAAGGGLASRSGKHDIYKRLTAISAMVPDLIFIAGTIAYQKGTFSTSVYSVCPVLHDGEIVKKIYKADDDGFYEDNGTFKSKTDNGKGVPVFTIDGLTVGVDICMDYNNERLLTYLQEEGLEAPDIHVQISGSNATSATRAVARDGGIYVHCDLGGKALNGASAYRVNGRDAVAADTNRIQPDQIQLPGAGGRLMYFTTPV